MGAQASFLDRRIDRGTLPFAVGDVLVIALLVTYGMMHHHGQSYVFTYPVDVLLVAAPFLIGWALIAPLVGAYSPGAGETAKSSVPLVVRSWILAVVAGFVLRIAVFPGGFDPVFAGVMLVGGGLLLGLWRWLVFKVK